MLDTRFPRPPGDIGHPDAFGGPTRHRVVAGAFPRTVVCSAASLRASGLAERFVAAVRALADGGAAAVTTSCGFLVLLQAQLQAGVAVPVVTSSLTLLPGLLAAGRRVGVLTIAAQALGSEHLLAAGVAPEQVASLPVEGVDPAGEFAAAILGNRHEMDLAQAERDVVAAARALQARQPQLTDLVLECTNMPPYADAVRAATGWRVFSLLDSPVLARALGPRPGQAANSPRGVGTIDDYLRSL